MNHLKMHSQDKTEQNIRKIAELFPSCVTEAIDANGALTKKIDFDMLRQELSCALVEGREERYQFTWPDKRKAILAANTPINKTLRPCREESVNFDATQNLYIEGDNLEVLKLLQETYLGKIKMIYIDPPYNTGNDFVYNDDFRVESTEWRAESGSYDESGNLLVDSYTRNTESNGRFHTDWLNMIYPRLKLARDLLSDDGVIFISIDDNEVENLKKICNEIFGEGNFIAIYLKQSKVGGGSDSKFIVKEHEYCLVYAKDINVTSEMFIEHEIEYLKRYKEEDENGRYFWDTFARPGLKNPIHYDIVAPDGTVMNYGWIHGKDRFEKDFKEGKVRIIKKTDGGWSVQFKQYLNMNGKKPRSMTMDFGGSIDGKNEIGQLFESEKTFSYPKSTKFIKTLFSTIKDKDSIILDFFSGSATTAHAVMQLNAEDGGRRKFIMVQLPELCDQKSEAFKAGYKNICEIGKERIRRAGAQILELSKQNLELGLENLEKEGLIEKIDNPKFSNLNTKLSKGEKYAGELSEIRSLEEVYGLSGGDLSVSKEVAERGNVCSVGPNEAGGGVDSVEHSGGASEGNEGVHSLSENSERLSCRIGNATFDLRTLEVLNSFGYRIASKFIGTNQQNDFSSDNTSKLQTLSSKLSVLNSLDIGFRVLKLDSTNMQDVYYSPEDLAGQDLFKSNIKNDRTAEDLLFQVMLDLGLMLSSKIEAKQIDGKTVYYVADGYLAACFDNDVTEETITKIAKEKPYYFVMRDSSMANDSVATNFGQIFATYSPETVCKVL